MAALRKRILIGLTEAAVLVIGLILSYIAGAILAIVVADAVGVCALLLGLIGTLYFLAGMRRKTYPWKIEYEAARWIRQRGERRIYPRGPG